MGMVEAESVHAVCVLQLTRTWTRWQGDRGTWQPQEMSAGETAAPQHSKPWVKPASLLTQNETLDDRYKMHHTVQHGLGWEGVGPA